MAEVCRLPAEYLDVYAVPRHLACSCRKMAASLEKLSALIQTMKNALQREVRRRNFEGPETADG